MKMKRKKLIFVSILISFVASIILAEDQKLRKKYLLAKISDDGNTLEFAYDWNAYPTVDPETWPYTIMHKK